MSLNKGDAAGTEWQLQDDILQADALVLLGAHVSS